MSEKSQEQIDKEAIARYTQVTNLVAEAVRAGLTEVITKPDVPDQVKAENVQKTVVETTNKIMNLFY